MLFIDHSRYFCAIGRQRVLSLGRWSSLIRAGFHVSDATRGPVCAGFGLSNTGLSPSMAGLSSPVPVGVLRARVDGPTTPPASEDASGLGSSHFARRY